MLPLLVVEDLAKVPLIDLLPANWARIEIVRFGRRLATMALTEYRRAEIRQLRHGQTLMIEAGGFRLASFSCLNCR